MRRSIDRRWRCRGTIGAQATFAWSTPAGIREEVHRRGRELGRAGLVL